MKPTRCLLSATPALLALASHAAAQFQASHPTARQTSVQAQPMSLDPTSTLASVEFTVDGPPGFAYATFFSLPLTVDTAWQTGGPTPGFGPYCVDITSPLTLQLTAPNASGTFPAAGPVSFVLPASSTMVGTRFRWQVISADLSNPLDFAMSNCGDKDVVAYGDVQITPADPFPAPVEGGAPEDIEFVDVERGDIDGDGDIDTVLLTEFGNVAGVFSTGGSGTLYDPDIFMIGPSGSAPFMIDDATSIELADVNNDSLLDLVVSRGSDPANNGGAMAQVHLNAGRVQTISGGTFGAVLGSWQGFSTSMLTIAVQADPALNFYDSPDLAGEEIETADIDQDGDLDLIVASSDNFSDPFAMPPVYGATRGAPNRIYTNMIDGDATTPDFVETTLPNMAASGAVSLFDPPAVPIIYDDSEDVEVADFDGNAFPDLLFANIVGPAATLGAERMFQNAGAPVMSNRFIVPNPAADETLDVAVADFNGDGIDDIYAGNWLTAFGGSGFGLPAVPDKFYVSDPTMPGIVWTDETMQLPDDNGLAGNEPRATSDVEIAQLIDGEPMVGEPPFGLTVVLGYGTKGVGPLDPSTSGVRLWTYRGPTFAGSIIYTIPPTWIGMQGLDDCEIFDMELGDANRRFFDLDVFLGVDDANLAFPTNYVIASRR